MRHLRPHRKVLLWWSRWWAAQIVLMPELSLGVHVEPARPLLDLFVGPLTLSVGKHPVLTDPRFKRRHSGRGFLYWDEVAL